MPDRVFTGSRSAILAAVSYYTEKPDLKPFNGNIARYAVGTDYHAVFRKKMRELRDLLSKELQCTISGKPFIDSVSLYEQGFASRHGVGFAGKNSLIITPKLAGSYCFIGELFVDIELEADKPYNGTCGKCFRCGSECPTGAIVEPGFVDANLCISFLTIENKQGIPEHLRRHLGDWVFGCDVCQEVCPYNQHPLLAPWEEFQPSSGIGHSLDLIDLLKIKNEFDFQSLFSSSALRRPKRRGLIRNGLIVLGNHLRETADGSVRWLDLKDSEIENAKSKIFAFAKCEQDEMLREHAYWAISQSGDKVLLKKLFEFEHTAENKKALKRYIDD